MPYDIPQIYPFYCSRYRDISFNEFMNLGYEEFNMKLNSLPETEPFYKVIKSRTINIAQIKDKEERKYWNELKRINKIPDIYKPIEELNRETEKKVKERGIKDVKRY